ncbi:ZYBA0S03-07734g1_1 [Zygosaccharomyces bailii CLIB 213]|uniref:ZYBA0S03-07734g1_1 n=1 Tax=Zygosaccharomyces bailii (strain CLIB 213 / ATCC 58445 / CBS 680 / BCRC 21525 / NBRC 1098 / NCYC 1416 / NRRL Y-2227) TaxID=1333698 RepID=A0A8J2X7D4_ZYGB2|nr:ZYBA0S03-07734g1_1 [Zygosaccharomyces bailii CLIB 213]
MNLFRVADFYINRLVNSQARGRNASLAEQNRIKALLLDKDTTSTISMCATQSELLNHEIYLVDTIENSNRDMMRHLRCIVYVKPTEETIQALLRELENPKYGDYHIFFSNSVSKSQLERLAEADSMECVSKVEEIFQDYFILNEDLFSFDMNSTGLFANALLWDEEGLIDCTKSLTSLLLSLKLKPEIRYDAHSRLCAKLAKEVSYEITQSEKTLFDFPIMDSPPILVLLDRKSDPLTPLLQPWTYQSMISEYIGVKRNMVDLSKAPDIDKDLQKVTLSSKQDSFFRDTMYLNFGELGDKVKQYVVNYRDKTNSNSQINTVEDIKNFIEKYPEFRKLSGNVAKHMAIVGELDRQLQTKDIWEVSEVEQNLAVHKDDPEDFKDLVKLLQDPKIDKYYKLKLACIYALRQGNSNTQLNDIVQILQKQPLFPAEDVNLFHKFRRIFGQNQAADETQARYRERDDLLTELTKRFNSRMNAKNADSDNVYMQHIPKLSKLLTDFSKNKVSKEQLKTVEETESFRGGAAIPPAQDIVVFIVGGATFEEARFVHEFNETMKGKMRVVLGGTSMLSTHQYVEAIRQINSSGI